MSQIRHLPRIDLVSDTSTKPTRAMREAIANAEVGDEQRQEDPTTNLLQERVADLLGKEAAIYLPSGCMCNTIAYRLHCRPGDEIILHTSSHPANSEVAAPAAIAGASLRLLQGPVGMFTEADVQAALRDPSDNHQPRSRVLSLEQTTNVGGGKVWPLEEMERVCNFGRRHNLALHLDGARLWHAVVKTGIPAKRYAALFDSVWVDFSKGLGCPVGAVLAGSRDFIREAWRIKHQLGGAMRQSGILAAACVYALDHHVERLVDDHENAVLLAQGLSQIPGLKVEEPETNMVFLDVAAFGLTAKAFAASVLQNSGVRFYPYAGTRLRAVLHLDVPRSAIPEVVDAVASALAAAPAR